MAPSPIYGLPPNEGLAVTSLVITSRRVAVERQFRQGIAWGGPLVSRLG